MQTTTQATPRTITAVNVSSALGNTNAIITPSDGTVRCADHIATIGDVIIVHFSGKLIRINADFTCQVLRENVILR